MTGRPDAADVRDLRLAPALAGGAGSVAAVLAMTEAGDGADAPLTSPPEDRRAGPFWRRPLDRLLAARRRRRRSTFILEVETDTGWRRVTLFRRPDEARAQLQPVAGMMPHLRLRVSKERTGEIVALKRYQVIALIGKIVCLGLVAALGLVLAVAWITG